MNASETLRGAREVLFERGWHQGALEGPDGAVCSTGAIHVAASGDPHSMAGREPALDILERAVWPRWAKPGVGIGDWNDENDRTFDEIVAAFERAEKLALIEEGVPT